MRETPDEISWLQDLMDRSIARSTGHLRSIIADERRPSAADVVRGLDGMRVLSLATVTARGEPRVSAVDGHLLHGRWTFGTSGDAAKARHLRARPSVSAAHIDGERFAVFCHGTAVELADDSPGFDEVVEHWTAHYGEDPRGWGDDIRLYRLDPDWIVAYGTPSADEIP